MHTTNHLISALRRAGHGLLLLACCNLPTLALSQPAEQATTQDNHSGNNLLSQSIAALGMGQKAKSKSPSPPISSRQAAVIAKQHAGGKVLRVRTTANGHQIKMLLPTGKVTYILVDPEGKIK